MSSLSTAYIALGANMDDPEQQIRSALRELGRLPASRLLAHSSLYRSQAEGYSQQPDFLNAVAQIETGLEPEELLEALLAIEQVHGRRRTFRNAPRTLDLDILLYGQRQVSQAGLHIPHPRMHLRGFVLAPLAELAADLEIPGHGRILDLLQGIPEPHPVRLPAEPHREASS